MRLRTFSAPTMSTAMREVRAALGPDAVIVATQRGRGGKGVRVTAAIEEAERPEDGARLERGEAGSIEPVLGAALAFHGTPLQLAGRLIDAALIHGGTPGSALAGGLRRLFAFKPLPGPHAPQRLILVGPPGVGKTVTAAKLALRVARARRPLVLITTDGFRAGGVDQLAALARVMDHEVRAVEGPEGLRVALADVAADVVVLIDSAGVNPFQIRAMGDLAEVIEAAGAEPLLTIAAGGDVDEAADIAASFGAIGAQRLIVTRLDAARRLGALLAAADGGRFAFSDAGVSPHIADGLEVLTPLLLARHLIRTPAAPGRQGE
jgi:flagellar biosynthesis protein FlhF